ncbi:MAG: FHA domain-containing protein [Propionibacteriaceae bacterium]|jgi:hypothetical protein|nr:FHA domain-containing protein [Propionibacteriaceae bacterium]
MSGDNDLVYQPGPHTLVCVPKAAVLVDLPADHELVGQIFDSLRQRVDIDEVLDILVSQGLRKVSRCAVAQWGPEQTRVVTRGSFRGVAPTAIVAGSKIFNDQVLGQNSVRLDGGEDPAEGPWLPIVSGVVHATAVRPRPATPPAPPTPDPEEEPAAPSGPPEESGPLPQRAIKETAAEQPPPPNPPQSEPTPQPQPEPEPDPEPSPPAPPPPAPEPEPEPAPVPAPENVLADVPLPEATPIPTPPAAQGRSLIETVPWAEDMPKLAPTPDPPPEPSPIVSGEHPVELSQDRRLITETPSAPVTLVAAVHCPAGHLSPPYQDTCRVCGQPIPPQEPFESPRPPLGALLFANGDRVPLDRPVIMGRNPRIPLSYTGEQPNLLQLADPEKDVSGQHLQIVLDNWHVLAVDLGSTNGTQVVLPGEEPVTLRPNDPIMLRPGSWVILAGKIEFWFEVSQ